MKTARRSVPFSNLEFFAPNSQPRVSDNLGEPLVVLEMDEGV
jgi:hypothetical protein